MKALRTPLLLLAALAFSGCEPSSRTDVQASTSTPGNAATAAAPPAAPRASPAPIA